MQLPEELTPYKSCQSEHCCSIDNSRISNILIKPFVEDNESYEYIKIFDSNFKREDYNLSFEPMGYQELVITDFNHEYYYDKIEWNEFCQEHNIVTFKNPLEKKYWIPSDKKVLLEKRQKLDDKISEITIMLNDKLFEILKYYSCNIAIEFDNSFIYNLSYQQAKISQIPVSFLGLYHTEIKFGYF